MRLWNRLLFRVVRYGFKRIPDQQKRNLMRALGLVDANLHYEVVARCNELAASRRLAMAALRSGDSGVACGGAKGPTEALLWSRKNRPEP